MSAHIPAQRHAEAFRYFQDDPNMDSLEAELRDLQALVEATQRIIEAKAVHARKTGMRWSRIGAALGMTRQGAFQKFTPLL